MACFVYVSFFILVIFGSDVLAYTANMGVPPTPNLNARAGHEACVFGSGGQPIMSCTKIEIFQSMGVWIDASGVTCSTDLRTFTSTKSHRAVCTTPPRSVILSFVVNNGLTGAGIGNAKIEYFLKDTDILLQTFNTPSSGSFISAALDKNWGNQNSGAMTLKISATGYSTYLYNSENIENYAHSSTLTFSLYPLCVDSDKPAGGNPINANKNTAGSASRGSNVVHDLCTDLTHVQEAYCDSSFQPGLWASTFVCDSGTQCRNAVISGEGQCVGTNICPLSGKDCFNNDVYQVDSCNNRAITPFQDCTGTTPNCMEDDAVTDSAKCVCSGNSCGTGFVCTNGQCVLSCMSGSDTCTVNGARQCSGNGYQTCGQNDADSCLEWSTVTSCSGGQTCSGGVCSSTCSNECTFSGALQCSGNGYQTCGENGDGDSCLDWSAVTSCTGGQTCSGGACITQGGGPTCTDSDGDGYGSNCSPGIDCNDSNNTIHPGATEICGNSIDEDCSNGDLVCPSSDVCVNNPLPSYPSQTGQGNTLVGSCLDYNKIIDLTSDEKKDLCNFNCASGANEPTANGIDPVGTVNNRCEWVNNNCTFLYDSVSGLTCKIQYLSEGTCNEQGYKTINITSVKLSGEVDQQCNAGCGPGNSCEKTIQCPRAVQLPFFGTASFILSGLLIVITYLFYVNRKKEKTLVKKKKN